MLEREIREDSFHHDFFYGRKVLSVDINLTHYTASLRFGTRDEWWRRRQLSETTVVFLMADSLLQEVSNQSRQTVALVFDSSNIRLKAWARSRKEILHFDSVEPSDTTSYRVTIKKTYFPDD